MPSKKRIDVANQEIVECVRQGDFARAITVANKAISDQGNQPKLIYSRGMARMYLEKLDEAKEDFTTAYEKSDNAKLRCDCLINRGAVHKKLRDFAAAQDDYELALELGRKEKLSKDTLSTLHMNRGQLFDKMLLPQKAVEEYSNYIALKGQLINIARNNRGLALVALKDFKHALRDFDDVIKSEPRNALFTYNKGVCLEAMGRVADALGAYRAACVLNPDETLFAQKVRRLEKAAANASESSYSDDGPLLKASKKAKKAAVAEGERTKPKTKKKSSKKKHSKKVIKA